MKTAKVNGVKIPSEARKFELERLVRFYASHGFGTDEIRKCLPDLEEKALEQAIGAKLLLDQAALLDMPVSEAEIDAEVEKVVSQVGGRENYAKALEAQRLDETSFRRELAKGVRVNKLVEKACSHLDDPSEEDVAGFFTNNPGSYPGKTLVDVHDQIKELLRHDARGRALETYVAELRAKAEIEYL